VEPEFWLKTVFGAGHNGVALFFSISGFILAIPFARQGLRGAPPVPLREYYLRRVTRIEPPYVIQLIIMMALCVFVLRRLPSHPHLFNNAGWFGYALAHILSSLIYMHSLIFGAHAYPNYVLWSLEVEVQFYLLVPFLTRIFFLRGRNKRRAILLGLIALGTGGEYFFGDHYRVWTSLAGNLHLFLLGFLFADLYVEGQLTPAAGDYKWDAGFVLALALAVIGDGPICAILLPVAIFICFMAAFRGVFTVRFLESAWITVIGGMCYTMYMYHVFMISFFMKATEKLRVSSLSLDLLIQFGIITAFIVPVSALLFVFLEKPFMDRNWPAKFAQKMRCAIFSRPSRLVSGDHNATPVTEPKSQA
jgi:peptidoglycan/LPS O-acetylase OafA/YrhL